MGAVESKYQQRKSSDLQGSNRREFGFNTF